MIPKKLIISLVVFVALGLAIGTYLIGSNHSKTQNNPKKVEASSNQAILSQDSEWNAGTLDNISVSGGDISINAKQSTQIDFAGIVGADHSKASGSRLTEDAWKGCDGNNSTMWNVRYAPYTPIDATHWWKIDIGSVELINRLTNNSLYHSATDGTMCFQYSTDDNSYTNIQCKTCNSDNPCDWSLDHTFNPPVYARYIKMTHETGTWHLNCLGCWYDLRAIELWSYKPGTATHATGATQITDPNFWQWQTFSPTYDKPSNADIKFRFRSSADGSAWNNWTDYQTVTSGDSLDLKPLVQSWSGAESDPGTFYKYIQVETKMFSIDGSATPTLHEYSIGYHTNRAPDKPTALTAVIGN